MGLFLALLYIFGAYLSPDTLYGSYADYHLQLIVGGVALLLSLLSIQGSGVFRLTQSYSLLLMCVAVVLSFVANGLYGLSITAILSFVPNAFIFYLILLTCRKKWHLQLVVAAFLVICLNTLVQGAWAIHINFLRSPYLMLMGVDDEGGTITRLRGLAFINDPNDFAQLLVSLVPCVFFFWKPGRSLRNTLFVLLPVAALVYAMFLTHSRGAILALLAVVILAGRRKLGTVPSAIIGGLLFAVSMAAGWSGGRDMSMGAGEERMEAWSTGLQLIRSHPIFGVGFGRFSEYYYITAHNTIVVCAAELGVLGLFAWVLFVFASLRDTYLASKWDGTVVEAETEPDSPLPEYLRTAAVRAPAPLRLQTAAAGPAPHLRAATSPVTTRSATIAAPPPYLTDATPDDEGVPPPEEIRRLARLMVLSLAGYLVAGWFLSRAYVMTLFIYCGMIEVIYSWALKRQMVPARIPPLRLMRISLMLAIGLVTLVYVMLRVQRLMPH
ncbi:MAG: O-antigen ligase family protein [Acidobacteriota bacterium]|nr:O-antigen ligase family protein [Acidobacteriota bacterium]